MNQEGLIAKKELLNQTDVSYGQLYRWKRKDLIPEKWFIRKSTFTGQGTFFPEEKIVHRNKRIKELKQEHTLKEIAGIVSSTPAEMKLKQKDLISRDLISKEVINLFTKQITEKAIFDFEEILYMFILEHLLTAEKISFEEGKILLSTLVAHYSKFEDQSCKLVVFKKEEVVSCLLVSEFDQIYFDKGTELMLRLDVATQIEKLKTKLN